jgi:hypothetical protein
LNDAALIRLGESAVAWARAYTKLTEALIREGVREDRAREEARWAAMHAAYMEEIDEDGEWP